MGGREVNQRGPRRMQRVSSQDWGQDPQSHSPGSPSCPPPRQRPLHTEQDSCGRVHLMCRQLWRFVAERAGCPKRPLQNRVHTEVFTLRPLQWHLCRGDRMCVVMTDMQLLQFSSKRGRSFRRRRAGSHGEHISLELCTYFEFLDPEVPEALRAGTGRGSFMTLIAYVRRQIPMRRMVWAESKSGPRMLNPRPRPLQRFLQARPMLQERSVRRAGREFLPPLCLCPPLPRMKPMTAIQFSEKCSILALGCRMF